MKAIASRQNGWFKRVRDAIRDHQTEIAIEGPKAIHDALAAGWEPIAIIQRGDEATSIDASETISFTSEIFDAVADTRSPQGVIGLFHRPKPADPFADPSRVVVALDGVQDPGNVGTIIRLAAAFDCAAVVLLPDCADPFGPKAIRASAGSVLRVPIATMGADALIASGWPLFAAEPRGKVAEPPAAHATLIFGSEGSGISGTLRNAAKPIAIPISPHVESLNVASSAAILLARSYALRSR